MVTLVHSVWTKPMLNKRWGIDNQLLLNLWYAASSVAYAKKIGARIILHTDELGKKLYSQLGYNEVLLTLADHDYNTRFWASGKIIAQEHSPLGSVHIDLDVICKSADIFKGFKNYDLVTQNIEYTSEFYFDNLCWAKKLLNETNKPSGLNFDSDESYCCGFVCFNNQQLKDAYIAGYKQMYKVMMNNFDYQERLKQTDEIGPDLVLEQYYLKSLCATTNARVKTLLPASVWNNQSAKDIGYMHVIGHNKYNAETLSKVQYFLFQINRKLFLKVEETIKEYGNKEI